MKKLFAFIILCVGLSSLTQAQSQPQHENTSKEHESTVLQPRNEPQVYYKNPQAVTLADRPKSGGNFGGTLGFIGGILLGYPMGKYMVGGEPNWALAATGGTLILVSLTFTKSTHKNSIRNPKSKIKPVTFLKLGSNKNGYGLTLTF